MNRTQTRRTKRAWMQLAASSLLMLAVTPRIATAGILANFDTADDWNQYPGVAGGGWTGGWTLDNAGWDGGANTYGTAVTTPLVADGGTYLRIRRRSTSGVNNNFRVQVRRDYQNFEDVNIQKPHQVSFLFRPVNVNTLSHNFMQLLGNTGTWKIETIAAGNWMFIVSDGLGGTTSIDTDLKPTAGHVYDVKIDIDPLTKSYKGSIKNLNTNASFMMADMAPWVTQSISTVNRIQLGSGHGYGSGYGQEHIFEVDSFLIAPKPPKATLITIQ